LQCFSDGAREGGFEIHALGDLVDHVRIGFELVRVRTVTANLSTSEMVSTNLRMSYLSPFDISVDLVLSLKTALKILRFLGVLVRGLAFEPRFAFLNLFLNPAE
jgi:hypothetical protein